jgi:hypothetical protein
MNPTQAKRLPTDAEWKPMLQVMFDEFFAQGDRA